MRGYSTLCLLSLTMNFPWLQNVSMTRPCRVFAFGHVIRSGYVTIDLSMFRRGVVPTFIYVKCKHGSFVPAVQIVGNIHEVRHLQRKCGNVAAVA